MKAQADRNVTTTANYVKIAPGLDTRVATCYVGTMHVNVYFRK